MFFITISFINCRIFFLKQWGTIFAHIIDFANKIFYFNAMFRWKNIDCSIKLRLVVSWDGNFSCHTGGEVDLDGFIWSLNSFLGEGYKLRCLIFFAPSSLTKGLEFGVQLEENVPQVWR